ncbi:MAG: ABC transporter permease [Pseudomonadota bacterium]
MTVSATFAFRYLFTRRSTLGSVSRLAVLGLVLSVAVLVIVISVVNGFERELRERVMGVLPHFQVRGTQLLDRSDIEDLRAAPQQGKFVALAPVVEGVLMVATGVRVTNAFVTGVDPDDYARVSKLPDYMIEGNWSRLAPADKQRSFVVVLGAGLAAELGAGVGDSVRLIDPAGKITPAGIVPRQKRFEVVGIFRSASLVDARNAYVPLAAAQKFFRTGDGYHGAHGRLTDLFEVYPLQQYVFSRQAGQRIRLSTWMNVHGPLYQAIAVQKLTMFILLSFLIGVAAFNLVSGLTMIVEQRKADVAILRTLGAQNGMLISLFLMLGVSVAFGGILLGLICGTLLAYTLPMLFVQLSGWLDAPLMTEYFISYLPVDVRLMDLLTIALAATLISLFSTVYPAWRSSRILPSRVLAHE